MDPVDSSDGGVGAGAVFELAPPARPVLTLAPALPAGTEAVRALLQEALAALDDPAAPGPVRRAVVLLTHDVGPDNVSFKTLRTGRATEALLALRMAEAALLREMGF